MADSINGLQQQDAINNEDMRRRIGTTKNTEPIFYGSEKMAQNVPRLNDLLYKPSLVVYTKLNVKHNM